MLKTVHSLEAEIIKLNEEADYNEIARLKAEELYQSVITALTTAENELTAKDKMIADLESERASNQDTQEINFETSEAILSSMQEKLDASSETVKMSTQELEACQERERALAARCIELETQVGDKEECLVELERSLSVMRATIETSEGTSSASEDALQIAEDARDAAITALATAENDLLKALEDADVYATERLALEETLVAKDKMIADLESAKRSSEFEQESALEDFEEAEATIVSLQEKLDASSETVKMSTQELEVCQERERALAARCIELETQVGDKEECLVELERSQLALEETLVAKDKMIVDLESAKRSSEFEQESSLVAFEEAVEEAEATIVSLQEKLDASSETVKTSTQELEVCQERERALAARCIELETQVGDKAKNNRSLQSKSKINVYLFVHCITCNCFEQSLFFL